MKAACYFCVFQSLISWRMRPSLILNLPNLLPGRLKSWLEAVSASLCSALVVLWLLTIILPQVTMEKRNYATVHI